MDPVVRLELWMQFLDYNYGSSCQIRNVDPALKKNCGSSCQNRIVDAVFGLEFWIQLLDWNCVSSFWTRILDSVVRLQLWIQLLGQNYRFNRIIVDEMAPMHVMFLIQNFVSNCHTAVTDPNIKIDVSIKLYRSVSVFMKTEFWMNLM